MISRRDQDEMEKIATGIMNDAMVAMSRLDLPPDICIGATVNLLASQLAALMDMKPAGAGALMLYEIQQILKKGVAAKRSQ